MANDYSAYVLEVLSGQFPALRNQFTLARTVYNHNLRGFSGRGTAKWTKNSTATAETKTEGTQLSLSSAQSASSVSLTPATHKVCRFHLEDGELSVTNLRQMAEQKLPFQLKALVNTIEAAIAAKQSSLTTNRVGSLGGGITAELMARAIEKLEDQEAVPETLVVHNRVKRDMTLDADIQDFLALRNDSLTGGNFLLNVFGFNQMGRSSQIYSPEDGQYVNLAYATECIGLAFGDLSTVEEGAGRFIKSVQDPITGITFRVVQHATADGLGQEWIIDVQYDIEVQEEALGVAILC